MIDQSTESQMTTEGHGNGFANYAPGMPVAINHYYSLTEVKRAAIHHVLANGWDNMCSYQLNIQMLFTAQSNSQ
jgi:hypothetical protein